MNDPLKTAIMEGLETAIGRLELSDMEGEELPHINRLSALVDWIKTDRKPAYLVALEVCEACPAFVPDNPDCSLEEFCSATGLDSSFVGNGSDRPGTEAIWKAGCDVAKLKFEGVL